VRLDPQLIQAMANESVISDEWNKELEEEVTSSDESLVVFSRDWTIETIVSQIEKGNIDLNPKFQRRNAWNDARRSKLIESLLIRVPVPEIVLAEDKKKRNSFLVIDGKQRLLAISGFLKPEKAIWDSPNLRALKSRSDLNGKSFADMHKDGIETQDATDLLNSDIRCTVISNYRDIGVLYDIFYRLNSGSVPLSSQELRQVLNAGPLANYLIEQTNQIIPLHSVLRLDGPDARLRDAELLLRHIAFSIYGHLYDGNLTPFLDRSMAKLNDAWDQQGGRVQNLFERFNYSTDFLLSAFPANKVGRKFTKAQWESRFNRALFEVQVYYFSMLSDGDLKNIDKTKVVSAFQKLCNENQTFQDSIEVSTKTIEKYDTRFSLFRDAMNTALGLTVTEIPVTAKA
jgi:hypothetical protein